jgi:hypothetical protein
MGAKYCRSDSTHHSVHTSLLALSNSSTAPLDNLGRQRQDILGNARPNLCSETVTNSSVEYRVQRGHAVPPAPAGPPRVTILATTSRWVVPRATPISEQGPWLVLQSVQDTVVFPCPRRSERPICFSLERFLGSLCPKRRCVRGLHTRTLHSALLSLEEKFV